MMTSSFLFVLPRPGMMAARQLRKVAACEAALERVVLEADEALGTYGLMGRSTADQVQ